LQKSQKQVYDSLYPKLVELRDQVAPALASTSQPAPKTSGTEAHEFFSGMDYKDLKKKAPAPPQTPAPPAYCSEIRLARHVIASLRNILGGGFAVSVAGLDEMIDEVVLAQQAAGEVSQGARMAATTPRGETACVAAGLGKSSW